MAVLSGPKALVLGSPPELGECKSGMLPHASPKLGTARIWAKQVNPTPASLGIFTLRGLQFTLVMAHSSGVATHSGQNKKHPILFTMLDAILI